MEKGEEKNEERLKWYCMGAGKNEESISRKGKNMEGYAKVKRKKYKKKRGRWEEI